MISIYQRLVQKHKDLDKKREDGFERFKPPFDLPYDQSCRKKRAFLVILKKMIFGARKMVNKEKYTKLIKERYAKL